MKTLPLMLVAASCFVGGFMIRDPLTRNANNEAPSSPEPVVATPKPAQTIELSERSSENMSLMPDSSANQTALFEVDEDLGGVFENADHDALTLQNRENVRSALNESTQMSLDLLRK